ncbi:MAG: coniferyl aldehyde dehydrogenase [Myxococcota bacterium]
MTAVHEPTPNPTAPPQADREPARAPEPPRSPAEDLRLLLERMKRAQRTQGAPDYAARMKSLKALERMMIEHKDEIATAISKDFGNRSRHESLLAEVFLSVEAAKHAMRHLREWMEPERRAVHFTFLPARVRVFYQPLGVIGVISPWNYPVQLAIGPLVGALAAGNRAIIKPSELTPETSEVLRRIVAATFPADQVAVVTGGTDVGEAFTKLPFDHLVFTGSTRVGKIVMKAASENLVPVTLELGGKSPCVVGDDIPLEEAAMKVMTGKLFNGGQTCIAPDYVMVPADRRDAFVDAAKKAVQKLYPRLADNPDYTSVINDRHYQRLQSYLVDAEKQGASLVAINPSAESLDPTKRKLAPTLVLGATEAMTVMQDEIFGPILPVLTYQNLAEAIDYINDHPRPLALYYLGYDGTAIDRMLRETISGGVTINETLLHFAQDDIPFGGVGASGLGHYHGYEGFESFSKKKPVFFQARVNSTALMRPPFGPMIERVLRFFLGK